MSDIRVVVVDDHELVRAGFVALIAAEPGLSVVGTAGRGDDAVKVIARALPDVVLMDVRMPGLDGISAITRLRDAELLDSVKVIVLTTFGLDEYVFGALRAGARGFLVKDTPPHQLLDAIGQVALGAVVLGDGLVSRVVDEFVRVAPHSTGSAPELTDRERDVLALVVGGLTNRQIARRLGVGEATFKTYVSRLLLAFGADSRVMLAVAALTSGAVRPH